MTLKILTPTTPFPNVEEALCEPNGLLAMGADLNISRLIAAYKQGIFPWYSDDNPILWWSPDPRTVIFLDELHIPHSLNKILRQKRYQITIDQAFRQVIQNCAAPRKYEQNTWLNEEMIEAYSQLFELGYAHSLEVWQGTELIGGIYGVDCGKVFTGESMFSKKSNASKIALVELARHLIKFNYLLLDCQLSNPFLMQFGTRDIPRKEFIELLQQYNEKSTEAWHYEYK